MNNQLENGVTILEKVSHGSAATSAASGAGVLMGLDWAAIGVVGGLLLSALTFLTNILFKYLDYRSKNAQREARIAAIRQGNDHVPIDD